MFLLVPSVLEYGPVVSTSLGKLRGERLGVVEAWRGVRYAEPPTGARRFAAAVPISQPWTGVVNATSFGSCCMQPLPIPDATGPGASEDCLFLNVYRPHSSQHTEAGGLPVVVWLHSGDLIWGSGSTRWVDGAQFVRYHDRILVTLNYRLGPLGFLPTDLTVEHGAVSRGIDSFKGSGGMNGLFDQITALQWVRDNIGSFGGNSSNVVLHGESAGGQSTCSLMASPLAQGLFQRAVVQSGPCTGGWGANNASTGRHVARQMLHAMEHGGISGCPRQPPPPADAHTNRTSLLWYLRRAPLVCTAFWPDATMFTADAILDNYFFYDGFVAPFSLAKRLLTGQAWALQPGGLDALLIGSNSRDGTTPFDYAPLPSVAQPLQQANELHWGASLGAAVTEQYPARRFGGSKSAAFVTADADAFVTCPTQVLAATAVGAGVPTYVYEFAHLSKVPSCDVCSDPGDGVGPGVVPAGNDTWASHGAEVRFVFNTTVGPDDMNASITNNCPFSVREQALVNTIDHYWSAFIASGSPNGLGSDGFPQWPRFELSSNITMVLTSASGARATARSRQKDCLWWAGTDDPKLQPH